MSQPKHNSTHGTNRSRRGTWATRVGLLSKPHTRSATAFGFTLNRLAGMRRAASWLDALSKNSVATAPGLTTLTCTPVPRNSRYRAVVKESTKDLVAPYSATPWLGRLPTMDPILTMCPLFRAFMSCSNNSVKRTTAETLTCSIWQASAQGMSVP